MYSSAQRRFENTNMIILNANTEKRADKKSQCAAILSYTVIVVYLEYISKYYFPLLVYVSPSRP